MMIIIGSFVVEAIAVAFFVWWRIFRGQPKRQQFGGPWAAGGFVIGGGVDDHGAGSSHGHWGCGGGGGDHGSGCGGSGCGGGGCGGGGGD
jgi:hypothetical protein